MSLETCRLCSGTGKCETLFEARHTCTVCGGVGKARYIDDEGRLIRAAGDVMRAQRLKGIAKYNSTLEDQNGYTVGGMIDMVAEELADGSVYVQKVREQYLALLDELENLLHVPSRMRLGMLADIIKRERGNV